MCEYCETDLKMIREQKYDVGVLGNLNIYLEQDKGKLRMGLEHISHTNTLEMFEAKEIPISFYPFCGKKFEG